MYYSVYTMGHNSAKLNCAFDDTGCPTENTQLSDRDRVSYSFKSENCVFFWWSYFAFTRMCALEMTSFVLRFHTDTFSCGVNCASNSHY